MHVTLFIGASIIIISELLLFLDVMFRGGGVVPYDTLMHPDGLAGLITRSVAIFLTPLCWTGFLIFLDGFMHRYSSNEHGFSNSPVRTRPWRFFSIYLFSIPVWLIFDWVNFWYIDAWRYHGLAENIFWRYLGYFLAFGAICPAMFMVADIFQRKGFARLRGPSLNPNSWTCVIIVLVGAIMAIYPFIARDPVGSLTLWLGWFLLLDPINERIGAPSILADWRQGRYGRTVSLMMGGAVCGLLWEFWNYWAVAKWTYNLPFLGSLESVAYFEMPVLGFLGFLPFALECWVMIQTIIWLLIRLGLRSIEPLPDKNSIT